MSDAPAPGMNDAPVIGVVSDTHGHYASQLDTLFAGAVRIIHAGDFGTLDVLDRLRRLAPLTVVAGNVDLPNFGDDFPRTAAAEVDGLRILVGHIGQSLVGQRDPVAEGFRLVVSGHSHRAAVEWRDGTLFLNPGSAGRARFGQPRTAALVALRDGVPEPRIVVLR